MLLVAAAMLLAQAGAAPAPKVCTTAPALPAALAGWAQVTAEPNVGKAFDLAAMDSATVRLAVPLNNAHPGKLALAKFHVDAAGVYSVAIGAGGWIDVISGTTMLTSVAHRHGAECSGMHKIVDFQLAAGDYTLEVTGLNAATLRALIAPAATSPS